MGELPCWSACCDLLVAVRRLLTVNARPSRCNLSSPDLCFLYNSSVSHTSVQGLPFLQSSVFTFVVQDSVLSHGAALRGSLYPDSTNRCALATLRRLCLKIRMKPNDVDRYYPVVGYSGQPDLAFNVAAVLDFYLEVLVSPVHNVCSIQVSSTFRNLFALALWCALKRSLGRPLLTPSVRLSATSPIIDGVPGRCRAPWCYVQRQAAAAGAASVSFLFAPCDGCCRSHVQCGSGDL